MTASPRILIVEDAPFIREVLVQLVESLGYQIVGQAQDGETAEKLSQELRPDLILMDLVLPKKNGLEATQSILKRQPQIKIIACSTLNQEEIMMQALDAGCIDYIVKPFTKADLQLTLQRVFQRSTTAETTAT